MNIDKINDLTVCFDQLELQIEHLCHQLKHLIFIQCNVFKLPSINKGDENEEIITISVEPFEGEEALAMALAHFKRLFIYDNDPLVSSKSAIRLPGALLFRTTATERHKIKTLITDINQLKKRLSEIVTKNPKIDKNQRFEFVHNQLKGLITLNAYRLIQWVEMPDTVRFGWANKNIIQKVDRDELIEQLNERYQQPRAIPPYSKEQWQQLLAKEIQDVSTLPADTKLKIKRPVKVQPIARVWYSEIQKQVQYACSSPMIVLLDINNDDVAKVGELNDYDANNIKIRFKPKAKQLIPLIPRLHLFIEK